jgi:antitoxin (DNA-binding transcriptional repressor) of toxin-antitoxin stability system
VITRHGRAVARVVSASHALDMTQSAGNADGFARYLLSAPKFDGLELPIRRSRQPPLTLGG